MDEVKAMLADLRGEGETVTCARCGKEVAVADAEPEEGGEWECRPCNERCNAADQMNGGDILNRPVPKCPCCGASGPYPCPCEALEDDIETCPDCEGDGEAGTYYGDGSPRPCGTCGGNGYVSSEDGRK